MWVDVDHACKQGISTLNIEGIVVTIDLDGVEVLADQMFDKVFHNLADNSMRHGKKVTKIWVHYDDSKDGLTLIYEDDGVGIAKADKERIFQRGEGKHTGYGLDLIKGILGITHIKISETGTPGKGARFELFVTPDNYRIAPKNG
jgi:signal transduction histidine kinase